MYAVWCTRQVVMQENTYAERLGRGLLAIMLGILLTIGTASSIGAMGPIYWIMAGLCVAYARTMNPPIPSARQFARRPTLARHRLNGRRPFPGIRKPDNQP